jgi:hypothetical protein
MCLPVHSTAARSLAKDPGQVVGESLSKCVPTILCGSGTGCVLAGHRPGGSWFKRGLLRSR